MSQSKSYLAIRSCEQPKFHCHHTSSILGHEGNHHDHTTQEAREKGRLALKSTNRTVGLGARLNNLDHLESRSGVVLVGCRVGEDGCWKSNRRPSHGDHRRVEHHHRRAGHRVRVEDAAGCTIGHRERQRGEGSRQHRCRRPDSEARLLHRAGQAHVGSGLGQQLRGDRDRELVRDWNGRGDGDSLRVSHQRDGPGDSRRPGRMDGGRGLDGRTSILLALEKRTSVSRGTYVTGDSATGAASLMVGVTVGVMVVVMVTVTWMVVGAAASEQR